MPGHMSAIRRNKVERHQMVAPPLRSCVACRSVRPKAELIRVQRTPAGALGVSLGAGSGRAAYVCPRRSCLEQGVKQGEFVRGLKAPLEPIEVDVLEGLVREWVSRKVASLLGLARRARKVVSGAEAVESAVKRRVARLVLIGSDASPSSVARFQSLAAEAGIACHRGLRKEELGAAMGVAPKACIAVTDPHFAEAVMSMLAKIPKEKEARGGCQDEPSDPVGRASKRCGGDLEWE